MGIPICLNTSTLRGHKLSLTDEIDIAAEAGYAGIEPWIEELDRYAAGGGSLPDLGRRIADRGLTVEGAIGFFEWIVDDEDRRLEGLREAERNMEMVALIGGKRIAAPPFGAVDYVALDLRAAADRYRALLELGDRFGVVPMVELWGFSRPLSRLGEAAMVAMESGHPRACILADVYHLYKGGSGFDGLRLLGADAIPVFHVNDYPASIAPEVIQDSDRVYPGDGDAPLTALFSTLRDTGFHGVLSLELFNETYWRQDPRTVARMGIEKTRAAIPTAQAAALS